MHLLFATNDAYVPHVATTLASVFESNKGMSFCVHVMATDISGESHRKLLSFVESYHHTLEVLIVNPDNMDIDLSVCGKWGIFPSLKLYAADLFPKVDRMLYLDADMICRGSLKPIEETDMGDSYIGMVTDEAGAKKHKLRLGLPADAFYGCAGLVLFDLDKWRKDGIRQKCFDYFNAPENRHIIKWGEQDVMNVVCQGHILELPIEYNMFSIYWVHHGRGIPEKYKATIGQHRRDAIVIHYIDACKPWFRDCRFPLAKLYWKYQALTPWKGAVYGYSPVYEGWWVALKTKVKMFLHAVGIRKYEYAYEQ